jgi:hypothetical protein
VPLLVESADDAFAGAVVGETVVLFPHTLDGATGAFRDPAIRYSVPAAVTQHIITGLVPGTNYDVTVQPDADGLDMVVQPGAAYTADSGGVVVVSGN